MLSEKCIAVALTALLLWSLLDKYNLNSEGIVNDSIEFTDIVDLFVRRCSEEGFTLHLVCVFTCVSCKRCSSFRSI